MDYSKKNYATAKYVCRGGSSPLCFILAVIAIAMLSFVLFTAGCVYASIPLEDSIYNAKDKLDKGLLNKVDKDILDDIESGHFDEKKLTAKNIHDEVKHIFYTMLGTQLYKAGDYEKALLKFKSSVEAKEDYSAGYNNLGLAYFKLSRLDDAKDAFEKSIECNENNFEAYNNLGSVYLDNGKFDEALKLFKKAKDLTDDNETIDLNIINTTSLIKKRAQNIKILIICIIAAVVFLLLARWSRRSEK